MPAMPMLPLLCWTLLAGPPPLHVAPSGRDDASGRADDPLATPARAIALRRAAGGGEVILHGGTYYLEEPLTLGPDDSGLRLRAADGEAPLLSGGRPLTGWRVADGRWTLDLPAGDSGFRDLWVRRAGEAWYQRRYRPTTGPFIIAGLTDAPAVDTPMVHRQAQDEFLFHPGDIQPRHAVGDVEIVATHDWSASRLRIREVDWDHHIVRFTGFPVYRIGHWYTGGRNPYFVENVAEALDAPGEWYLDRAAGRLTYLPLPGETPETVEIVAPRLDQLLIVDGADDVRIEGLHFAHTRWQLPERGYSSGQGMIDLPAAIEVSRATDFRLIGGSVANTGAHAVRLGAGCARCAVSGVQLYDLGGGGVYLGVSQATAQPPVLPVDCAVEDCLIRDVGQVHYSAHGVWVGFVGGARIAHNEIARVPYSPISIGWKWDDGPSSNRDIVVEYNHLHEGMTLLADGGGIYSLGRIPGTVLRGNLIHGIRRSPFAGRAECNGIFLDQGSSEFQIEGNVIWDTSGRPVRHNQNTAEQHTWVDNTFARGPEPPAAAEALAARVGPRVPVGGPAEVVVAPTPILAMVPPRGVAPIHETFEALKPGSRPPLPAVQTGGEGIGIAVTDQQAASGRHSLEFRDGPGAAKVFYPYIYYTTGFGRGRVTAELAVRVGPGARVRVEARADGDPATSGWSLVFLPDGKLRVEGGPVLDYPLEQWVRLRASWTIDGPATTYDLTVTLPDGTARTFADLPCRGDRFAGLEWFGILGEGTDEASFWIDDLRLELTPLETDR